MQAVDKGSAIGEIELREALDVGAGCAGLGGREGAGQETGEEGHRWLRMEMALACAGLGSTFSA